MSGFFLESWTFFLLYLLIGGTTDLYLYLNAILYRHIKVTTMPDNWLDGYMEPTLGKVKCLMCQSIFARKPTKIFSNLGYEGPSGNQDKGVSLCRRVINEISRLFNKCGGVVPMYPGGAGPNHLDSYGIPWIGKLHLLWYSTSQSIDPGSSRRLVEVGIQGSQTNPGEANSNTYNSIECVSVVIIAGQPLRQARKYEAF
jgi:hypothetical protein